MTGDLVKRLRDGVVLIPKAEFDGRGDYWTDDLMTDAIMSEAADRIEALTAKLTDDRHNPDRLPLKGMTEAGARAILSAYYKGEPLDFWSGPKRNWTRRDAASIFEPLKNCIYRIPPPEPVVETVTHRGRAHQCSDQFSILAGDCTGYRPSGTVTTTKKDGKPVRIVWQADR